MHIQRNRTHSVLSAVVSSILAVYLLFYLSDVILSSLYSLSYWYGDLSQILRELMEIGFEKWFQYHEPQLIHLSIEFLFLEFPVCLAGILTIICLFRGKKDVINGVGFSICALLALVPVVCPLINLLISMIDILPFFFNFQDLLADTPTSLSVCLFFALLAVCCFSKGKFLAGRIAFLLLIPAIICVLSFWVERFCQVLKDLLFHGIDFSFNGIAYYLLTLTDEAIQQAPYRIVNDVTTILLSFAFMLPRKIRGIPMEVQEQTPTM